MVPYAFVQSATPHVVRADSLAKTMYTQTHIHRLYILILFNINVKAHTYIYTEKVQKMRIKIRHKTNCFIST